MLIGLGKGDTTKEGFMMQTITIYPISRRAMPEQRQRYRIKRQFSTQRRLRELVRDLLRAHSGK